MTTRRFNYTNQRRIGRDRVQVAVHEAHPAPVAVATVDLAALELPAEAPIVLEAYADYTLMRFPFGTVASPGANGGIVLSEFDAPEGIRFRVKVLGTGQHAGLILAEADGINTVDSVRSNESRSFIVVRPADLGNAVWRLSVDESAPVLSINNRLSDWKSAVKSSAFRSLVLPEVLRILVQMAVSEGDDDERAHWMRDCIAMSRSLSGLEPPSADNEDLISDYADSVVEAFCRRYRMLESARALLEETEE